MCLATRQVLQCPPKDFGSTTCRSACRPLRSRTVLRVDPSATICATSGMCTNADVTGAGSVAATRRSMSPIVSQRRRMLPAISDPVADVVHDVGDEQGSGRCRNEQLMERVSAVPGRRGGGQFLHGHVELQDARFAGRCRKIELFQQITHRLVIREHEAAEQVDSPLLCRLGETLEQQASQALLLCRIDHGHRRLGHPRLSRQANEPCHAKSLVALRVESAEREMVLAVDLGEIPELLWRELPPGAVEPAIA